MTFAEISLWRDGYEEREARRKQIDRLTATTLLNVYRKKGSAPIKAEHVYPLVTDKKAVKLMTVEDYEAFNKKMDSVKWQTN